MELWQAGVQQILQYAGFKYPEKVKEIMDLEEFARTYYAKELPGLNDFLAKLTPIEWDLFIHTDSPFDSEVAELLAKYPEFENYSHLFGVLCEGSGFRGG